MQHPRRTQPSLNTETSIKGVGVAGLLLSIFVFYTSPIVAPAWSPSFLKLLPAYAQTADSQPLPQSEPATSPPTSTIDASQFLRVARDVHGNPIALETSLDRYVGEADGSPIEVTLVGAVHIAEKSYFDFLNKEFTKYDVVLYELIAPEGNRVPGRARGGNEQVAAENPVSALQKSLTQLLGLSFQLEEIDYTKRNFVHADMSPEELAASMKKRNESLLATLLKVFRLAVEQEEKNPQSLKNLSLLYSLLTTERTKALRRSFAAEFENLETVFLAVDGPNGSTILTERNRVALSRLAEVISSGKKKIAIFYGAAHLPDMARRLQSEFGLKREGSSWIVAWKL